MNQKGPFRSKQSITTDDILANNIRRHLGVYITFAIGKKRKSSVILFSGSRLESTCGYLLAQASYNRFNQLSHNGQAGSVTTDELLKCCR